MAASAAPEPAPGIVPGGGLPGGRPGQQRPTRPRRRSLVAADRHLMAQARQRRGATSVLAGRQGPACSRGRTQPAAIWTSGGARWTLPRGASRCGCQRGVWPCLAARPAGGPRGAGRSTHASGRQRAGRAGEPPATSLPRAGRDRGARALRAAGAGRRGAISRWPTRPLAEPWPSIARLASLPHDERWRSMPLTAACRRARQAGRLRGCWPVCPHAHPGAARGPRVSPPRARRSGWSPARRSTWTGGSTIACCPRRPADPPAPDRAAGAGWLRGGRGRPPILWRRRRPALAAGVHARRAACSGRSPVEPGRARRGPAPAVAELGSRFVSGLADRERAVGGRVAFAAPFRGLGLAIDH